MNNKSFLNFLRLQDLRMHQLNRAHLWSALAVVGTLALALYGGDTFAAPEDGLRELGALTEMAEKANKTASWIAGGTALSLGAIYAMVKQSPLVFGSALVVALGAYKGAALITAAMVI